MTESFLLRSVISDDVILLVSGLQTAKAGVFVCKDVPSPTLIGRIERSGRFLKVRNAAFQSIMATELFPSLWRLCFQPPTEEYAVVDHRKNILTSVSCKENRMVFKNESLGLNNLLLMLSVCMIINMDCEHSQMVPPRNIAIYGSAELWRARETFIRHLYEPKVSDGSDKSDRSMRSGSTRHLSRRRSRMTDRFAITAKSSPSRPSGVTGQLIDLSNLNFRRSTHFITEEEEPEIVKVPMKTKIKSEKAKGRKRRKIHPKSTVEQK